MSATASAERVHGGGLVKPILIGGGIAGTLDQISAFLSFGWRVPRIVASGLIGSVARTNSSIAIWILGLALHFFIAFSAAAVYCLASRRLPFLKDYFVVCGMFYGIAVYLVMYLVVMPLCAFHYRGPYTLSGLLQGVIIHMLLIGLPIGWSLNRWGE